MERITFKTEMIIVEGGVVVDGSAATQLRDGL